MLTFIAKLEDPVCGVFLGKTRDGKMWKNHPNPQMRSGGVWKPWEGDPIELALTGQHRELEMAQELQAL